jgi:hypothetical protein
LPEQAFLFEARLQFVSEAAKDHCRNWSMERQDGGNHGYLQGQARCLRSSCAVSANTCEMVFG